MDLDTERLKTFKAFVGLDGFVDQILTPVKIRQNIGSCFIPYASLRELGETIGSASGSNFNIELYPKFEKLGGNGPLFANVLVELGVQVKYIGCLGNPIHPVFKDFSKKTHAISLGKYGETSAIELSDGKLILGKTQALDSVTYDKLLEAFPKDQWIQLLSQSKLVSWQNWTMLFHLNDIFKRFLQEIWPFINEDPERVCFFDLADPAKRTNEDVEALLSLLPKFRAKAQVYLGVNRSEAYYLSKLLKLDIPSQLLSQDSCKQWIEKLKSRLNVDGVIMHCKEGALAACSGQTALVTSLSPKKFACLTGSGDHFNGGCMSGFLMKLPLEECLFLGHTLAKAYIETGMTPSLEVIQQDLNA